MINTVQNMLSIYFSSGICSVSFAHLQAQFKKVLDDTGITVVCKKHIFIIFRKTPDAIDFN